MDEKVLLRKCEGCKEPFKQAPGCVRFCSPNCRRLRHGHARVGACSVEFSAWAAMNARYRTAGLVVQEWTTDFSVFIKDMGHKPVSLARLDRPDRSKPYGPANCRWLVGGRGKSPARTILKRCAQCSKAFTVNAHEVKRGKAGTYCSKTCVNHARRYKRTPPADRFWLKVKKAGADECWIWIGARYPSGYGKLADDWRDGPMPAHRFSYKLHHGPIPEGLHVMHSCDNRPCVNPRHLSVGTCLDNMRDKVFKNRSYRKLPAGAVRAIRQQAAQGVAKKELATLHQVHISTIYKIVSGRQRAQIL